MLQPPERSKFEAQSPSPGVVSSDITKVFEDLQGAVNQRNYPMVGKDQGALDSGSLETDKMDGSNAMRVNVNSLAYPIEGYDLMPVLVGEADITEDDKSVLLDLSVPMNVIPAPPKIINSSPRPARPVMAPMGSPAAPMMRMGSPAAPMSPMAPMGSPAPPMGSPAPPMSPMAPMMGMGSPAPPMSPMAPMMGMGSPAPHMGSPAAPMGSPAAPPV